MGAAVVVPPARICNTFPMKRAIGILIIAILMAGSWWVGSSSWVHQRWYDLTKPKLPVAENINLTNTVTNTDTNGNQNTNSVAVTIPAEKNLAVPFTTQAPGANWDADHEEFCEEAAVVMAGRFFSNRTFSSTADAEAALQQAKTWEVAHLGFYFDTTAAETAELARGVYGVTVTLKTNPTITDIKQALAENTLVIVPTAGRQLGNPNFKSPGPIYHNLVIRGFTKDGKFITNDPGTRKGEAYVYDESVIMNAMHDWVPNGDRTKAANGDASGQKVILIVSK